MPDLQDVFISLHEKSSLPIARQITKQLKIHNISCWIARDDILSGQDWSEEIVNHITACKLFLVILNKEAALSRYVKEEVRIAHHRYCTEHDILIKPVQVTSDDLGNSDLVTFYLDGFQIGKLLAQKDSSGVYVLDEADVSKLTEEIVQAIDPLGRGSVIKEYAYTPNGGDSPVKLTFYESGIVELVCEGQTFESTFQELMEPARHAAKRREPITKQVAELERLGIAHSSLKNVRCILDDNDQQVLDLHYANQEEWLRIFGQITDSYATVLKDLPISETTKREIGERIASMLLSIIKGQREGGDIFSSLEMLRSSENVNREVDEILKRISDEVSSLISI